MQSSHWECFDDIFTSFQMASLSSWEMSKMCKTKKKRSNFLNPLFQSQLKSPDMKFTRWAISISAFLDYFDPKIYTLSKKLQFSHYHVNQHFSGDVTMQCTATLILYLICPLKQEKKHPHKWEFSVLLAGPKTAQISN